MVSEFLNPIPRDELMEESGLFSLQMEDPFANLANTCSAQPPANHHIQVQVVVADSTTERFSFGRRHRRHGLSFFLCPLVRQVNNESRMVAEEVTFDPFPHSETDTSMLFGDDYPLSYSYEIL